MPCHRGKAFWELHHEHTNQILPGESLTLAAQEDQMWRRQAAVILLGTREAAEGTRQRGCSWRLAGDQKHVLDTNAGPEECASLDLFSLAHYLPGGSSRPQKTRKNKSEPAEAIMQVAASVGGIPTPLHSLPGLCFSWKQKQPSSGILSSSPKIQSTERVMLAPYLSMMLESLGSKAPCFSLIVSCWDSHPRVLHMENSLDSGPPY